MTPGDHRALVYACAWCLLLLVLALAGRVA